MHRLNLSGLHGQVLAPGTKASAPPVAASQP